MRLLGIKARAEAVFHQIIHPTHWVLWRINFDPVCDGDIVCETCQKIFWCRSHDLSNEELNQRIKKYKMGV